MPYFTAGPVITSPIISAITVPISTVVVVALAIMIILIVLFVVIKRRQRQIEREYETQPPNTEFQESIMLKNNATNEVNY